MQNPSLRGGGDSGQAAGEEPLGVAPPAPPACAWRARIGRMEEARRAFAKALHLNPTRAALWGNCAASYHFHASLRRAHPELVGAEELPGLQQKAERLLRGGLRIDPLEPRLWAALGQCAEAPSAREAALSRALMLDPKYDAAWVALGRLYREMGHGELAAKAYEQARVSNPDFPPVWEDMASLSIDEDTDDALRRRAADLLEYAAQLHGSGSGQAASAVAALAGAATLEGATAPARPGRTYASARRAAECDPTDPLAALALALASEQRGLLPEATRAAEAAAALLEGTGTAPAASSRILLRHAKLSLARCSAAAGQPDRALALLREELARDGGGGPLTAAAASCLAGAQMASGNAAASAETLAGAVAAADGSEAPVSPGLLQLRLDLVKALCHAGAVAEAAAALPAIASFCRLTEHRAAGFQAMEEAAQAIAFSAVLVGGAGSRARERLAEVGLSVTWLESLATGLGGPRTWCRVLSAASSAARRRDGPSAAAARLAARAVHCCPWDPRARELLAREAAAATPMDPLPPSRVYRDDRHGRPTTTAPALAVARAAAFMGTTLGSPAAALRRLQRAVHERPSDAALAASAARAAVRLAPGIGARGFRAAAALCRRALAVLAAQVPAGDVAERLLAELRILQSEALLGARGGGASVRAAAEAASEALNAAAGDERIAARARLQAARCRLALGDPRAADEAHSLAADKGSSAALVERAEALAAAGRAGEALALLQAVPGRGAALLAAALLLDAGDGAGARAAAGAAAPPGASSATRVGSCTDQAASFVSGAAAALAACNSPGGNPAQLLGEARHLLSRASGIASDAAAVQQVSALSCLLLAVTELASSHKKKEERAPRHLAESARRWPAVVPHPAALLELEASHQGSPRMAAKALHMYPSRHNLWETVCRLHSGRSEAEKLRPEPTSGGSSQIARPAEVVDSWDDLVLPVLPSVQPKASPRGISDDAWES